MSLPRPPSKLIDTRIPLPWLIGLAIAFLLAAGTTVWTISGQYTALTGQLTTIIAQQAEMKTRFEKLDSIYGSLNTAIFNIQRTDDKQDMRLDAVERALLIKPPLRKER